MIGTTISHYKILEKLGEGGMGIVYKAHDTTLDRDIALKFLPAHLSASEQDKARFIQEAKAAATLDHPNICTIHSIEEHEGQLFIAMQLVDGQLLRDRMSGMTRKQAIELGIQIADGLAAAHEKGVVHRDIKPENIMIRKDGIAQIMDFGLAKLKGVSRLTKEGSTVGTAGYMSPEQVQGQDADHRSDIFSIGVLLYEMLTGQLPFKGVHETAVAYEIVNVDAAPMSAMKSDLDPALDAIVLECLEKDPNERAQSAKQVGIDLKRFRRESSKQHASRITAARPVYQGSSEQKEIPTLPGSKKTVFPWLIALASGSIALLFVILYLNRPEPERSVSRSLIRAPEHMIFASGSGGASGGGHIAVSPDGLRLTFVATDSSGTSRLFVRPLSSTVPLPLPGTEGAYYPFWSANSQFIGFFASGKLRRIDASGGPPLTICDASTGRGGSWNQEDIIVFTPTPNDPLYKVPAAGGIPEAVTVLDTVRHESTHRFPWFLPDGRHFLYFARISSGSDEDAAFVGSLDGTVRKQLFLTHSNVAYASGHLLFIREQALMAQPFNPDLLETEKNAVPVAEQVKYELNWNRGSFGVSQNGLLVFEGGIAEAGNRLAMVDKSGKNIREIDKVRNIFEARLSPDERKIALSSIDDQSRNMDLWVYDLTRSVSTRFTFDPKQESDPVWSPDGKTLLFASDRSGTFDIYRKSSDGTGTEDVFLKSAEGEYPSDWSSDGKLVVYTTLSVPRTRRDIWMVSALTGKDPVAACQTEFLESEARFSPDGRWLAYGSDESGRRELYVRPSSLQGGKWQVSGNGIEFYFCWQHDGRALCYVSSDGKLTSVEVDGSGSTFTVGSAKSIFDAGQMAIQDVFDISRDARTFLVLTKPARPSATNLELVINWDKDIRR